MSVEHLAGDFNDQWRGQAAGFTHFAEFDFTEDDVWNFAGAGAYGGARYA